MSKLHWKAGTMLYPVPAVMVSCGHDATANIITVAWAGTVCTNPAMLSISIRKERHSYDLIVNQGDFVVNLSTKALVKATDFCGVKSGRDVDKFSVLNLTKEKAVHVKSPLIKESPLNIECRVKTVMALGSHDLIIAEVLGVNVDASLLNETGKLELDKAGLIAYSHGGYFELGPLLGTFGYSVKKQGKPLKKNNSKKPHPKKNTVKERTSKQKKSFSKTSHKKQL
jgi:flavin reductase (DIM6/NTAB) family NADH-FMN oxidoreductase RutF